jgi:hypothetical protein
MRARAVWLVLLGLMALALSAPGAGADRVTVINTYGVTPLIQGGTSYVPLRSASDFLGAALLWDSLRNRATITYNGRELGLVVGSTTAYYGGQPVVLAQPPVMVNGKVLVPAAALGRYLEVPVRWDGDESRVLMLGPPGWGYYHVTRVARVHRDRGLHLGHRVAQVQVAGPFMYSGVTYLPLRDVSDVIGAALLWDHLRNRATLVYDGRNIVLVIGSPTVHLGSQTVVLPAAPIIVGGQVFVPEPFFAQHLRVKVEHEREMVKVRGAKGSREWRVSSSSPDKVFGVQGGGGAPPKGQQGKAKGQGPKGKGKGNR